MFRDILGHLGDVCFQDVVPVQVGHFGAVLDPDFVLNQARHETSPQDRCKAYLCILGQVLQGSDMELELFRLCKLAKADAKRDEVVPGNVLRPLQHLVTSDTLVCHLKGQRDT